MFGGLPPGLLSREMTSEDFVLGLPPHLMLR